MCHSWIGLLLVSLLSLGAHMAPVLELHSAFSSRDLAIPPLRAAKGSSNNLYVLGACWTTLSNNTKEGFLCLVLGFLLGGPWLLEGALSSAQMRKFYLKYICIFICRLRCVIFIIIFLKNS